MKRKTVVNFKFCAVVLLLLSGLITSCDVGLERRDCVVILGDSIFALSGAEYKHLKQMTGHEYRTFYRSGAQMQGGSLIAPGDILDQYNRAIRGGRIRTMIVDGGGNDGLLGPMMQSEQAMMREVAQAWEELLTNAKRDGVENVVVQGYYKTVTGETASTDQWRRDTERQLVALGQELGLNLAFIQPGDDPWFANKRPAQYTIYDGIHPTDAASKRLAELVWQAMQQNNIEQGEGCQSF